MSPSTAQSDHDEITPHGADSGTSRDVRTPADSRAPLVSVIILSYNALDIVRRCLPSVHASTYSNLEIIFADNASTDATVEWVENMFPEIVIVRHPENFFFCRGNNEAVAGAKGKYIALLNNDVEVDPNWLAPLVSRMESDRAIGAVQPKLLQHQDRSRFEYAGGAGGHLDRFGYPFVRGRIFFELERDEGQYDTDEQIFWATGAAILLRRDIYQSVGGLDERFKMHMEEIDLCWRLQRRGYRIESVCESVVYHIGSASLPRGSPDKTYLNYRNNLLAMYKNLPKAIWWRIFPVRVLLDGLGILRFLFLLQGSEALAVLRAYMDVQRLKSEVADERPAPGESSVIPFYRRSIVLDYYVRRKRTFSALLESDFSRGTTSDSKPVNE